MSSCTCRNVVLTTICAASLAMPAWAQKITEPKQGKGGSVVQGSSGTDGSKGDENLEHCDTPMGAVAVVEPQSQGFLPSTKMISDCLEQGSMTLPKMAEYFECRDIPAFEELPHDEGAAPPVSRAHDPFAVADGQFTRTVITPLLALADRMRIVVPVPPTITEPVGFDSS